MTWSDVVPTAASVAATSSLGPCLTPSCRRGTSAGSDVRTKLHRYHRPNRSSEATRKATLEPTPSLANTTTRPIHRCSSRPTGHELLGRSLTCRRLPGRKAVHGTTH
jgi:hypothetical protein